MTTIVFIEDDERIASPVVRSLKGAGFQVYWLQDGLSGLEATQNVKPDLVLLDLMLPKMDGWEVCKGIRKSSIVPILMVTALSEEVDRILGLELGADDYITKPFSTRELIARIKAMLRRVDFDTQPLNNELLELGVFKMCLSQRKIYKHDQELILRYKEFELLSLLIVNVGQVVTRAEIFDKVWGTDWLGDMRTLDVHIRWIREKIEDDPKYPQYIQTVRGVGYRFVTGTGTAT